MSKRRSPYGSTLILLLAAVLVAGCAGQATTGAFTQTHRIEGELTRGVSTRMDVRRVLGTPKGAGHAVFPFPTDWQPREVWYYEDLEVTDVRKEAETFRASVRQQILLVFFEKGVFDGFMWWSSAGKATEQQQAF
jgi:hypothetical protein